ncbi:solute carrier family 46 member 3 [Ictalurus punctatus]|uniref:Lysosomal proton-coupled steroid conjugate and bile acid symporter SLC46A3 n=1 Tax=Ictalurus punctatus TaxID=7998 RepID=A0A979FAJ4_ICTPU|nr:solute carrier family 46 member 3 [Ictalurus punctatus]
MGCVTVIEPVVGLHAFAMFMTYPLLQQYIYRRLWEQLSGSPFPVSINQSHCSNNYTDLSIHQAVQRETSHFLIQTELSFLFPSLVSSLFLVSYSDSHGRKVAMVPPLLGSLLFTLTYFIVSKYSLSLSYLLGAAFFAGLFGGTSTLIGGCFSYVADCCGEDLAENRKREKTVRMARLDMVLGVLSGLGSLCTGFYIQAAGFSWPFLSISILHLLNLIYVLGILKEPQGPSVQNLTTNKSSSSNRADAEACHLARPPVITRHFHGVYLLFAASTRRRNAVLLLILSAFVFYKMSKLGAMSIFLLYELNPPLCWSEVFIGYGSALDTLIYLSSYVGVSLLSRWLSDAHITLLGLLSVATGFFMTTFAKTTLLMFLVRLLLLLSIMPAPVMRSMMSKMVLSSEQGAVFACMAFVEMLSFGVAFPVFSSIYAATISWFSGFTFLLAASLTLIPALLIGVVLWLRLDMEEESKMLTTEDDGDNSTGSEITNYHNY